MARETKTRKHVSEVVDITKVVCDLCKKEASDAENLSDGRWGVVHDQWGNDIGSVIVSCRVGAANHEDGSGDYTQTFFDICPECFQNVLVPILRGLGAEPQIKKVSW